MKSHLVLAVLLLNIVSVFAQLKPVPALIEQAKRNGTTFSPFSLFQANKDFSSKRINEAVKEFSVLKLDVARLKTLMSAKSAAIEVTLPYLDGEMTLEMVQKSVLSEDFSIATSDGQKPTYNKGLYFRGNIKGDPNSVVALSFFDNEVYGVISDLRHGDMVLGRIETKGNTENYILYAENQMNKRNPFECHSNSLLENQKEHLEELNNTDAERSNVSGCIRSFLECDFKLYQNKGNNVANTVNYITAIYNNVATLYNNEQISTVVSQVYVWTFQDAYPTTSSSSALTAFKTTRGLNFNGDLAHLAALGGSNLGGVAWLDVLCVPSNKYAYSNIAASYNTVPTYSWSVMVMTHEMGHNIGSPHTQSCTWPGGAIDNCYTTEGGCAFGPAPTNGGTIMSYCHLKSYGINFANGFGPLPGQRVRTRTAAATCLAASCAAANTCAAPTSVTIPTTTATSADVNWVSPSGATAFNLRSRPQGSATWTTANNVVSPYTIGNLLANTTYIVEIQSVCGTGNSDYTTGVIFKTQTSTVVCGVPTSLAVSNVTQNTATATWTAVSGATNYTVQYKTSTATTWSSVTATTTSVNLTGLQANTIYNVQVSTNCSTGNASAFTSAVNFTTSAAVVCGVPTNLAVSNINNSGATVTWTSNSGAVSFNIQYKTTAATTWTTKTSTTPTYTITGLAQNTSYEVKVQTVCATSVGTSAYTSAVPFTTTTCPTVGTITFSNVAQNTTTATWAKIANISSYKIQWKLASATSWNSQTLTDTTYNFTSLIPNTTYNVKITTNCGNTTSLSSAVQDFTTALCPTVAAITFSNIGSNTATATWASVGNFPSYRLQWKLTTATTWNIATITTTTYNFTNLVPNSTYDVQIITNCTNGNSVASTTQPLQTTICPVPTTLTLSNIGVNGMTATWAQTGTNTSYRLQWKKVSATTWSYSDVTGTTYNITNLTANTAYEVQVRTNCSGLQSTYSASENATTLPTPVCSVPTGLTNTGITNSSATLTWIGGASAVTFSLQYKLSTATAWTTVNGITASPYTLTGLSGGLTYNVKVRSNCAGTNNSSAYSTAINVTLPTTLIGNGSSGGNDNFGQNSNFSFVKNVTLSPNPVQNIANLRFNFEKESNINVQIVNTLGQVIFQNESQQQQGTMEIDMSNYERGIYFVKTLINDNELISSILVKN